jgi:UDP-N-acetylmuramate--alanine ligase
MGLCPKIEIVTTLEMDHPDMFASLDDVRALFSEFVGLLPANGLLIAGADAPEVCRLAEGHPGPVTTYGLSSGDWQAVDITSNQQGGTDFRVLHHGKPVATASLQVPGTHHVANALAALVAADALGAPLDAAAEALREFSGVGRRFEVRGMAGGVTVIDDYAHHPTAIRATLQAARARYGGASLWAVWQPHTYRRTKELLGDFASSFGEADHVIITDVYRSRDTQTYGVSPDDVVAQMADHPDVQHIGPLETVVDALAAGVQPGDVVIVMSAGDATRVVGDLLAQLRADAA